MHFCNYRLPKTWLDKYPKRYRLRVPLDKQHVQPAQKHLKCERQHVYHIY